MFAPRAPACPLGGLLLAMGLDDFLSELFNQAVMEGKPKRSQGRERISTPVLVVLILVMLGVSIWASTKL